MKIMQTAVMRLLRLVESTEQRVKKKVANIVLKAIK
jgi:hypothetical protein